MKVYHTLEPIYSKNSTVLILGSMPSVVSREKQFYYRHPQNRFWRVLAALTNNPLPQTNEEMKNMLQTSGIALWDVISSCEITGSSDASIKDVTVNDIGLILKSASIKAVFLNGSKAGQLYRRYCKTTEDIPKTVLPSTSPANASYSLERLIESWSIIKQYLIVP